MAESVGSDNSDIVAELVSIKRLLVLQLLKSGASQAEIAAALDISQPSVSRMFPKGVVVKS